MFTLERNYELEAECENNIIDFYKDNFVEMDSWYEWNNNNIMFKTHQHLLNDGHPTVTDHLNWVQEKIYPKLNKKVKSKTVEWCDKAQKAVMEFYILGSNNMEKYIKDWNQGEDLERLKYLNL
jgi:hypothetical protein